MTKIQAYIADYVHANRLEDDGNYAINAAEVVARAKDWDVQTVAKALRAVRTSLFQLNSSIRKADFTQRLAERIIRDCRRPMSTEKKDAANVDQSVHFHGPVNTNVLQTGQRARTTIRYGGGTSARGQMVEPAYLDAFTIIAKVAAADVADVAMPIKVPEVEVRKVFETLIGESFHAKDSGVESCDTFSTQGTHGGKQCAVAAMLKGAGGNSVRWPLQVAGCGKNGNQVVRLFEVPADVYIVQGNGPFDPTLVKHIQDTADAHASRGRDVKFMLIDGISTARLLRAAGSKLV